MKPTKILIIALCCGLLAAGGCKSTKTTKTTKIIHRLDSTTVRHVASTVTLPVRNITVIERPCKENKLQKIDQVLTSGKTTVSVKTIKGSLAIEIDSPKDSAASVNEVTKIKDVKDTSIEEVKVITRYRVPKWFWYILAASIGLNIWAYRGVIRKLLIRI